MEWTRGEFILTDAVSCVDRHRTHGLLEETYWGVRRPFDVVEKMIENSLCFALLKSGIQIGFARAVSDYTVFAWIADLVIAPTLRSQGLGKWMMTCIMDHPRLRRTQFVLQTRDAHELYAKYGFSKNEALMSTPVPGL